MSRKKEGKNGYLTVDDVGRVVRKIAAPASESNAAFCLIGGACFKLMGVHGYETKDVDFAATADIKKGMLAKWDDPNSFSWNENGHYNVLGVKVDFIHKLSDGTKRLFTEAVKSSVRAGGMRCATLEYACAIRLAACRKKDVSAVRKMIRDGWVKQDEVVNLVMKWAPESTGAKYVRAKYAEKWGSL